MRSRSVVLVCAVITAVALSASEAAARQFHVRAGQSVQAAVDAASDGDVIRIDGLHVEQVVIAKRLTLRGTASAVIRAPSTMSAFLVPGSATPRYAIVLAVDTDATVDGLVVDGASSAAAHAPFYGIAFVNAGGAITRSEVRDVGYGSPTGIPAGTGVLVINPAGTRRRIAIAGNRVTGFNYQGISVQGDPNDPTVERVDAQIIDNVVVGSGPTDRIGQFGILMTRGAVGHVLRNVVRDIAYDGVDLETASILSRFGRGNVFEGNVVVNGTVGIQALNQNGAALVNNRLSLSDDPNNPDGSLGIWIVGTDSNVVNNTITGPTPDTPGFGGILVSGTSNRLVANTLAGLDIGVYAYSDFFIQDEPTSSTTLVSNRFTHVTTPVFDDDTIGLVEIGSRVWP